VHYSHSRRQLPRRRNPQPDRLFGVRVCVNFKLARRRRPKRTPTPGSEEPHDAGMIADHGGLPAVKVEN
jgi:hypothetical protein